MSVHRMLLVRIVNYNEQHERAQRKSTSIADPLYLTPCYSLSNHGLPIDRWFGIAQPFNTAQRVYLHFMHPGHILLLAYWIMGFEGRFCGRTNTSANGCCKWIPFRVQSTEVPWLNCLWTTFTSWPWWLLLHLSWLLLLGYVMFSNASSTRKCSTFLPRKHICFSVSRCNIL